MSLICNVMGHIAFLAPCEVHPNSIPRFPFRISRSLFPVPRSLKLETLYLMSVRTARSSRHEYPQYRKVHVNDMSLSHSRLIVGV